MFTYFVLCFLVSALKCEREQCFANNYLTGTGAVYSFDPVGSYEREACRAAGAAQALIQPFLDNQVGAKCYTYRSLALQIYFLTIIDLL